MIKKVLLIMTACAVCLATQAQNTSEDSISAEATIKAAEVVIKKYHPRYVEKITDEICEKFKKNPKVMTGIAEAYLYTQRDTAMAYKYLRKALGVNRSYAPAYCIGGEIEASERDTAKAVEWYEKGIAANPKNPDCYLAYAKLMSMKNPAAAQKRIEELLTHDPAFPVNLELAKMYERVADNMPPDSEEQKQMYQKSIDHYALCDINTIPKDRLLNYGIILLTSSKDYEKALEVVRFGAEKFKPTNSEFNRLGVNVSYGLKNWGDAVDFGEALFKADSVKPTMDDYWNLARAYSKMKKYSDAIATVNNIISNDSLPEEAKIKQDLYLSRAQWYQEIGDWTNAMKEYEYNLNKKEENGTVSASDIYYMANAYRDMSTELNGEDKQNALKTADSCFAKMAEKFPDNMSLALYMRLIINMDLEKQPNGERNWDAGLVKPIAEQLISVIQAKNETDELANNRLINAYNYLAFYYMRSKQENIKTAKTYFQKILELDPNNENALKVLEGLKGIR